MAPSLMDRFSSTTAERSMSETRPVPSQCGHMPPVRSNLVTVFLPSLTLIAPCALTDGTLNEYAPGPPTCGSAIREKSTRSMPVISVTVPNVERVFAANGSWPTMIAAVRPSRCSTSVRARDCMKPCTKPGYVSLINRWDSAATVSKSSEDLPEPDTPVKTVSLRLGISMLTFFKLLSFAPTTRIYSRPITCASLHSCSLLHIHLRGQDITDLHERKSALRLFKVNRTLPRLWHF